MKQLLATLTSATLFGFMCLVQAVQATTPIGMVDLIQGQVFARSQTAIGTERKLTAGASIYEGDTIETVGDGAVVLDFKDGTRWDIYDESVLTVEEYNFSEDGSGDSAIYAVHSGELTYVSGEMGIRGSSVEIKTGKTSIYPQGTEIEFITVLGVTIGTVVEGTAQVVTTKNGQTTDDKVATEGMWFVKDAAGNITVVKNKGQAQKLATQALKEVGVGKKDANKLAKITAKLVKKGIGTTEVDKDAGDLLQGTPAEGGGETLVPASPS